MASSQEKTVRLAHKSDDVEMSDASAAAPISDGNDGATQDGTVDTSQPVDGSKDDGDGEGSDEDVATAVDDADTSKLAQRELLDNIEETANYLREYQTDDGVFVSANFQRLPNKRHIPDYFEVIKEPMALSTVRQKCLKKTYTNFSEFVHDVALICHNALLYNLSTSEIAGRAIQLRDVFVAKLKELVENETITSEEAELPDFGEIPADEDTAMADGNGEDGQEEGEDDEDDGDSEDDEDDDEEGTGRRRGRARVRGKKEDDKDDDEGPQKRGRPPKVYTPMEARIQALLKGLRKSKGPEGVPHIYPFERLPDKAVNKEYYAAVANPIALDAVKKKAKRKKYSDLDQVMADLDLIFTNAMNYNEPGSDIHNDAVALQKYAKKIAAQEKAKPDDSFRDEDGKLPLSSAEYDGQKYEIGDWVLIRNLNDPQKPIVSQIFRLWQDESGQRWVNACWYYRPEQTVHRASKRFFNNEVVKTGQYRDHHIEDIVGQCFVMFITRYFRGRPRDFAGNKEKEVYVCEARYNEDKFTFNKIKTWTSCLPDEVREKDYVMDMFPAPRPQTKEPSPIKHLIKTDAKETDALPKPTWGNPNAPPIIGAVHMRPREHNDSLSPPPIPVQPVAPPPEVRRTFNNTTVSPAPAHPVQPTASPAMAQYGSGQFVPPIRAAAYPTAHPVSNQTQTLQTSSQSYLPHASAAQQHPSSATNNTSYNGVQLPQAAASIPHHRLSMSHTTNMHGHGNTAAYKTPEPYEVWRVREDVAAQIPADLRDQYLRDDHGRLLFFTQPPQFHPHPGVSEDYTNLGHSVRYLADKQKSADIDDSTSHAREEPQDGFGKRKLALQHLIRDSIPQEAVDRFEEEYNNFVDQYNADTVRMQADLASWRREKAAWNKEQTLNMSEVQMTDQSRKDKWAHYHQYNDQTGKRRKTHFHAFAPPSVVKKTSEA